MHIIELFERVLAVITNIPVLDQHAKACSIENFIGLRRAHRAW